MPAWLALGNMSDLSVVDGLPLSVDKSRNSPEFETLNGATDLYFRRTT